MVTEKRLIDPDKLSKATIEYCGSCFSLDELEKCGEIYVDAVEVVHGRWVPYHEADIGYDEHGIRCSNCRLEFENHEVNFPINYCPKCGAKMDGAQE